MDISKHIKNNRLKLSVKPNTKKNEITGIVKDIIKINIKAPAENNKANIEIIKFFAKYLNKKVFIISGLKSKNKILKVI